MPTPFIAQIDIRDLTQDVVLGISLPLRGAPVFTGVYSTKDAVKYKLINLLLTNKGEKPYIPSFGCDLRKQLFEPINDDYESMKIDIRDSINYYVPEVDVLGIEIIPNVEEHILNFQISYKMKLSGQTDLITIAFE